jgi:uridine kinase
MAAAKQIKEQRPRLIAIAGGSGSGKTWLAEQLQNIFSGTAARFSLDNFYLDRSQIAEADRSKINFDHPNAIDWKEVEKVLRECRENKKTFLPHYDFATHTGKTDGVSFSPRPFIFVDGLWLLRRRAIRELFDCKVFLECPAALRLERRLRRDCAERGRCAQSVHEQFSQTVAPMHQKFVEPQKRWADIIFNRPPTLHEVHQLAKKLKALPEEKSL